MTELRFKMVDMYPQMGQFFPRKFRVTNFIQFYMAGNRRQDRIKSFDEVVDWMRDQFGPPVREYNLSIWMAEYDDYSITIYGDTEATAFKLRWC